MEIVDFQKYRESFKNITRYGEYYEIDDLSFLLGNYLSLWQKYFIKLEVPYTIPTNFIWGYLQKYYSDKIEKIINLSQKINEGEKDLVKEFKYFDSEIIFNTLKFIYEKGEITKETFTYILDYVGRYRLAKMLGYNEVPKSDPKALEKFIGFLKKKLNNKNKI